MSHDNEFVSWNIRTLSKHGENLAAFAEEASKPNLNDFLSHHREQCIKASEVDTKDYRWNALRTSTEAATDALQAGDVTMIAMAFFRLGQAANDFSHPSVEEQWKLSLEALQACHYRVEKLKRERPLITKNGMLLAIKEIAQRAALMRWTDDTAKEIRLGEMCVIIFAELYKASKDKDWAELFPDKSDGLKPWLREVAPDYAKKHGRPKKNKK
jgi:hypothetical protein